MAAAAAAAAASFAPQQTTKVRQWVGPQAVKAGRRLAPSSHPTPSPNLASHQHKKVRQWVGPQHSLAGNTHPVLISPSPSCSRVPDAAVSPSPSCSRVPNAAVSSEGNNKARQWVGPQHSLAGNTHPVLSPSPSCSRVPDAPVSPSPSCSRVSDAAVSSEGNNKARQWVGPQHSLAGNTHPVLSPSPSCSRVPDAPVSSEGNNKVRQWVGPSANRYLMLKKMTPIVPQTVPTLCNFAPSIGPQTVPTSCNFAPLMCNAPSMSRTQDATISASIPQNKSGLMLSSENVGFMQQSIMPPALNVSMMPTALTHNMVMQGPCAQDVNMMQTAVQNVDMMCANRTAAVPMMAANMAQTTPENFAPTILAVQTSTENGVQTSNAHVAPTENNDISIKEPEKPKVQNVVCTLKVGCPLDLKYIVEHAANSEYNPRRFAALTMRIRKPNTTALIFKSGEIVCTGAKSKDEAKIAIRKFARIIQQMGFPVKLKGFKIQNIVASFDVKFPVFLEKLEQQHARFASYEVEIFPGLTYRMRDPNIVMRIFSTGKVILTGAKTGDELMQAYDKIYPTLLQFRKDILK